MKIQVKTPTHKTISIELESEDLIGQIKIYLEEKSSVPVEDQIILYKGLELREEMTLTEAAVNETTMLSMIIKPKGHTKTFVNSSGTFSMELSSSSSTQ